MASATIEIAVRVRWIWLARLCVAVADLIGWYSLAAWGIKRVEVQTRIGRGKWTTAGRLTVDE